MLASVGDIKRASHCKTISHSQNNISMDARALNPTFAGFSYPRQTESSISMPDACFRTLL